MFGNSSHIWEEGEGMLHALYFKKGTDGGWIVVYNNRHVETEIFNLEKHKKKSSFLPTIEGDSPAILSAYSLNLIIGKMMELGIDRSLAIQRCVLGLARRIDIHDERRALSIWIVR